MQTGKESVSKYMFSKPEYTFPFLFRLSLHGRTYRQTCWKPENGPSDSCDFPLGLPLSSTPTFQQMEM